MILPWITLAATEAAIYTRLIRGPLSTRSARTTSARRGLRACPNGGWSSGTASARALAPVVSQLGVDAGALLGGVVVVEVVFGLGGLGQTAVESVSKGDLPVILGAPILAAIFVVVANIVVDMMYAVLDPRVRIT